MEWRDYYFVDMALPFGLRSAPFIFSAIANVVEWILVNNYGIELLDDCSSRVGLKAGRVLLGQSNRGCRFVLGDFKGPSLDGSSAVLVVVGSSFLLRLHHILCWGQTERPRWCALPFSISAVLSVGPLGRCRQDSPCRAESALLPARRLLRFCAWLSDWLLHSSICRQFGLCTLIMAWPTLSLVVSGFVGCYGVSTASRAPLLPGVFPSRATCWALSGSPWTCPFRIMSCSGRPAASVFSVS